MMNVSHISCTDRYLTIYSTIYMVLTFPYILMIYEECITHILDRQGHLTFPSSPRRGVKGGGGGDAIIEADSLIYDATCQV